ncbi:hypothetical protein CXG81DRAFT_14311 [Caulochytrium protostelioides]|uniref:Alpha/beta-hydrolase n=1 Tax=Caulochytrium protostelioides TaxID=1555241 RepID=A0A4V1IU75_9FUNG|nr:alpha/beta-hydrolase [Caulochytrium protostelioides]RKO99578.1 hypothetical protein CXG81DRAFT_14311 [Caulochytrium protostelioides]|eukprot:RKO99578.1 hypothetical protein CXG81DRAFT_14311 [Caulochytrium protostelioides]
MKAEWTDFKALPTREKPAERVIILIHGGAFFSCQRKTHRGVAWRLAKYADARVLSIDYRLSPECSFPDPIAEVLNAYAYLIDPPHPKLPKYRPDQITLCGDSAGGNLATAAVLWIRDHPGRLPMPAGLIGLSPWLDLLGSQPSWLVNAPFDFLPNGSHDKRYVNADRSHYYVKSNQYLAHPLCSPLFNHELPNAPICPTFITVGTVERLRDEAIVFAYAQFPNSPISIDLLEDMPHVSQIFAGMEKLPRQSLKRVGAWVKLVCGPNRTIPSRKCTLLRNDRKVTALNVPNPMAIVEHSWQVVGKYGIARLTRENAEIQKGALEYGLSVGETRRKGSVLKAFTID